MTSEPEREVDDRLADWVDGRLSERDRERFVAELRVNPQLRQDLEDYERTVASVRAALGAPTVSVPMADRVLAAIAKGGQAGPGAHRAGRRTLFWSLVSAAALLGLAVLVNSWKPAAEDRLTVAQGAAPPPLEQQAKLRDGEANYSAPATPAPKPEEARDRDLYSLEAQPGREAAPPTSTPQRPGAKPLPEGDVAPVAPAARGALSAGSSGAAVPVPDSAVPATGAPAPDTANKAAETKDKAAPDAPAAARSQSERAAGSERQAKVQENAKEPNQEQHEKQDAGAAELARRADPASPALIEQVVPEQLASGAAGRRRDAEPVRDSAAAPPLPHVVVQGATLAALAKSGGDEKASQPAEPEGDSRKRAKSAPASEPRSADGAGARGGPADDASRKAQDLPARLDAFFVGQMQAGPVAGEARLAWAASGSLRFSPLPAVPVAAQAPPRGPATEGPAAPGANPAVPGGPAGTATRARGGAERAVIERSWLVEGSKDEVQLVLAQLARFARGSDLRLSTGETVLAAQPTPSGARVDSTDALGVGADAGRGTRVVITFRGLPR